MAVAYATVATASNTADVTSIVCNKPAGTSSGDLLVAAVNTGSGSSSFKAPSGWTALFAEWTDSNDSAGLAWYKVAGSSEPASYTFTWQASSPVCASVARFTGADTTAPIRSSRVDHATRTAASFTSTALSDVQSTDLTVVIGQMGDDNGVTGYTVTMPGSPWTTVDNITGAEPKWQGASYATGPQSGVTFTSSSSSAWWNITTVAIAEAAAPSFTGSVTAGLASTGTGTSAVCDLPTGTVEGDLLVAAVNSEKSSSGFTAPSGWTTIVPEWTDGTDTSGIIWYKVAGSSEPSSYTFTWTGSAPYCASVTRITGIDTSSSPVRAFQIDHQPYHFGGNPSYTSTALPGVLNGDLTIVVAQMGDDNGTTGFTVTMPSSPWTTVENFSSSYKYQGSSYAVGPQPGVTFTSSSEYAVWNVTTFALIPEGSTPSFTGSVTAAVSLAASVAGEHEGVGSPTATLALGASVTGQAVLVPSGSPVASMKLGASATGIHEGASAPVGSLALTGKAVGSHHSSGAVTAALKLSAFAVHDTGFKSTAFTPLGITEGQFSLSGLIFGKGTDIRISDFEPTGIPSITNQDTAITAQDGLWFGVDYQTGRLIELDGWINCFTASDAWQRFNELVTAYDAENTRDTPGAVLELQMWPYGCPGPVSVFGRPRQLDPATTQNVRQGVIPFTSNFQCENALYFGAEQSVSSTLLPGSGGGFVFPVVFPSSLVSATQQPVMVKVGGKAKVWPVIRFLGPNTGSLVNPTLEYVDSGITLTLLTTILPGEWVQIDARPWATSITNQDGGAVSGLIQGNPLADLALQPGTSTQIAFKGADLSGTASMQFSWRNASKTPYLEG